jgi:plasmid maintenance system antidote protein VapI
LRFKSFFGTSAEFWMGLQDDFDLEEESLRLGDALERITRHVVKPEFANITFSST